MKRLWSWLKAEWALAKKQAECPHLNHNIYERDECPDCGHDPLLKAW